jgi:TonB family protein
MNQVQGAFEKKISRRVAGDLPLAAALAVSVIVHCALLVLIFELTSSQAHLQPPAQQLVVTVIEPAAPGDDNKPLVRQQGSYGSQGQQISPHPTIADSGTDDRAYSPYTSARTTPRPLGSSLVEDGADTTELSRNTAAPSFDSANVSAAITPAVNEKSGVGEGEPVDGAATIAGRGAPHEIAQGGGEAETEFLSQFKITDAPRVPSEEILSKIVYPPLAAKEGIEATVYLELFIDQAGNIRKISVLKDPGYGFAEAAIQAFAGIVCQPALVEGHSVAVRFHYPIRFRLK